MTQSRLAIRVGHANDVTAMAFAADRLFCSTRDNAVWTREPALRDVKIRMVTTSQVLHLPYRRTVDVTFDAALGHV